MTRITTIVYDSLPVLIFFKNLNMSPGKESYIIEVILVM